MELTRLKIRGLDTSLAGTVVGDWVGGKDVGTEDDLAAVVNESETATMWGGEVSARCGGENGCRRSTYAIIGVPPPGPQPTLVVESARNFSGGGMGNF